MRTPPQTSWCRRTAYRAAALWLLVTAWPATPATGQMLLVYGYGSAQEMATVTAMATRVRYVTAHRLLVEGTPATVAALAAAGLAPLCRDVPAADEGYYLEPACHHADEVSAGLIYRDAAGWALYRLRADDPGQALPHFRLPLPERFDPRGWQVRGSRPRLAATGSTAVVAEALARVDLARLQRDVRALALRDPAAPSAPANLRTRFTVHDDTYGATEYLRRELATALGDSAVGVRPFPVDPNRLSAHVHGQGGPLPASPRGYNVVGVLPGSDPTAGCYVICAHYDATGVRTPGWNWATDPAPGADDNGTGAALVLETARVLAGQTFPWSIRFVEFSGEELGLLGSRAFAEAMADSQQAVLGVLNFDMFGCNGLVDRIEVATNPGSRWLAELMASAAEQYGLNLRVDILEDDAARLSDHASFWARGYDAILAIENYLPTDASTAGVRQGLYRVNRQYHTVLDVPDSITWSMVHKTTQLAVATLAQFATGDGQPNLAVFPGDVTARTPDSLTVHVSNIGRSPVIGSFGVRLSRCADDTTDCVPVHAGTISGGLPAGSAADLGFPWHLLGEQTFRLEVDTENAVAEEQESDNQAVQRLLVQPLNRVAVYPNPFVPARTPFVTFTGLPTRARVHIRTLGGQPVWTGAEERQGTLSREVRWQGDNAAGYTVGSGVYWYQITTYEGDVLVSDKLAVVR
jgi:hypothetical protein